MKSKKIAVVGMSAALLFGAGGGFLMSLPTGASAGSTTVTTPTDPVTSDTTVAADSDADGARPGRGQHLGEALQALVDDGTITAAQVTALIDAAKAAHDAAETAGTDNGPQTFLADTLAAQVASGSLTQAQADAITAALQAAHAAGGNGGPGSDHGGRGGDHGGRGERGPRLEVAATALGITSDALKTELQAGKTIAEVATAQGVDVQKVIDALVADATTNLTERITNMVNGVHPADEQAETPVTTG
jgi:hypothetical protein